MDAIILVGGKGTRLQSTVSDRPKPMAEVAGRPFVEWVLLALRAQGLRRVIMATGYKWEHVESYFGDGVRWGLELRFVREAVPLGTGGAARYALEQVQTDCVLVLNGDSFCPVNIARLANVHRLACAQATLWVVPMGDCRRYGTVTVGKDGSVIAFHEKTADVRSGLISAGVYLFDRSALANIPQGCAISLETDIFPALVGQGLKAAIGERPFLDIGTPESFSTAESFIAQNWALWHTGV